MVATKPQNKADKTTKQERPEYIIVQAQNTACPVCKSLKRSKYYGVVTNEISGVTADGSVFTHVSWKRCKCLDCGQTRNEKHFEDRTE